DGIRDRNVTGVQTCALPISSREGGQRHGSIRDDRAHACRRLRLDGQAVAQGGRTARSMRRTVAVHVPSPPRRRILRSTEIEVITALRKATRPPCALTARIGRPDGTGPGPGPGRCRCAGQSTGLRTSREPRDQAGLSWMIRCLTASRVELRGFEPLTSSMPWKRATNCAIAPYRVSPRRATGPRRPRAVATHRYYIAPCLR